MPELRLHSGLFRHLNMEISASGKFSYKRNGCNDSLAISINVEDGKVARANIDASGCRFVKDVAEKIIKIIKNKKVNEVVKLTNKEVEVLLNAKSDEKHAVECFVSALNEAIADYKNKSHGKDLVEESYELLANYNEGYPARSITEYED